MKNLAAACLLAVACTAIGAEPAYVPRATVVLESPAAGARALGKLGDRQAVEVVGRKGAWLRIRAPGASGWVALSAVRLEGAAVSPASSGGLKPIGRNDSGIRGFSEEELLVGAPNRAEAAKLNSLAVPGAEAERFAQAGKLQPRRQDYLEMQDYVPAEGFPPDFFDE
jgi:hypothetical protein